MKLILANWSTPADFDCFCDDHGVESVADLACPQGSVYRNTDDAKAACVEEVKSCYDDHDEELTFFADATWHNNGYNQHNLVNRDVLLAVLIAREVGLEKEAYSVSDAAVGGGSNSSRGAERVGARRGL